MYVEAVLIYVTIIIIYVNVASTWLLSVLENGCFKQIAYGLKSAVLK